ncbi:MAG TPA: hypothetical protein VHU80_20665 [Polyangiaceae bacterium]|nr:hypothetical protein [Polyangiaceae bacterium]
MNPMSRGKGAVDARARFAAALAACAVACSSGIDGYNLVDDAAGSGARAGKGSSDGGDANGDGGGGTSDSGGTASGGNLGDGASNNGGAGNAGASNGGTGNRGTGGTGSGGRVATGGNASGGVNTGGAANGGSGNGGNAGAGTGGGNGGSAGKGTGGVSTGGTGGGNGGNGGASTGGMGGAGGIPVLGNPVVVTLNKMLTGITAAAWSSGSFYLLQPIANQFWRINIEALTVVNGPYPLPSDSWSTAFGASAQSVFVATKTKVYRVPAATGSSSVTGVPLTNSLVAPAGGYANGYFLLGDSSNGGSTPAQALSDAGTLNTSAKNLGTVYQVAGDGANVAFTTFDVSSQRYKAHVVAGGTFTRNASPCTAGALDSNDFPISVAGSSVAWVLNAAQSKQLNIGTVSSGTCSTPGSYLFGSSGGPSAVGLIDANDALVFDSYVSGSGNVVIIGSRAKSTPATVVTGTDNDPKSIIVGGGHYAVVVTGNIPGVLEF